MALGNPQPVGWQRSWLHVGSHRDGNAIRVPVARARGPLLGPAVLLIAGVHGDEVQGIEAARDVLDAIDPSIVRGSLTIIPVANPMAYGAAVRRSPADSLDLNRTFPGAADGTPTERLAAALWEVARTSDAVISLHSWYVFGDVLPYVEFPSGIDDVALRSRAIARASGLGYNRLSIWHPGLLVAAATRNGVPAVEIEIGGLGRVTETSRRLYSDVLNRILRFLGCLPSPSVPDEPIAEPIVVAPRFILAPTGGFFRRKVELGQTVEPDDPLGEITDLFGEVTATIRSGKQAIVGSVREHPAIQAGDLILYLFDVVEDGAEVARPRQR